MEWKKRAFGDIIHKRKAQTGVRDSFLSLTFFFNLTENPMHV